jgi:hypothetical protein
MKQSNGILILIFLCSSVIFSQEKNHHFLQEVDLSQVWSSGFVPDHDMLFDPLIEEVINQANLDSLISYVRALSGEDSVWINGDKERIEHRVSDLNNDLAAEYIFEKLISFGLDAEDQEFSEWGRNVLATKKGYLFPDKSYIISAHYDAVDNYCADDNASGVAAVLEAARILSKYDYKYSIVFAFWDEEESGLIGSQYFASQANSNNLDIQNVLNLDMIGYDSNDDGLLDIHTYNVGNSNTLANLLIINNAIYDLPLSPVIYNPGTWQSDHSSFWEYDYGAVMLIEAYYGADFNPFYHSSEDRIDNFNLHYFHNMSKLALSAVSTLIEITEDTLIAEVSPEIGYKTYHTELDIRGIHTNFSTAQKSLKVWLSRNEETIKADRVVVYNNTAIKAFFYIPMKVSTGLWDVNVKSDVDGLLKKENSFNILPSPALMSVSPETLSISIESGSYTTRSFTIHNIGDSDLEFNIFGHGPNKALQFDGADDEVILGDDSSLDLTGDITICAWFKTDVSQWGSLVSNFDQHGPDNGYELTIGSLYEDGGFIYFECTDSDLRDGLSTDSHFNDGEWHFVSAVLAPDGTTRGRVFVDAVEQFGKFNPLGGPIPSIGKSPGYQLKLGASSNREGPEQRGNYEGLLDEVRIWERALSPEEIQKNMYSNLDGSEMGLVGYWNFNEATTDSIFDLAATGTDGKLKNGVHWVSGGAPVSPDWFIVEPDSGVCTVGSTAEVTVTIDATELEPGDYLVKISLMSNDPFNPRITVSAFVSVTGAAGLEDIYTTQKNFRLDQNYPNPFNPSTIINYELPITNYVDLSIYNLLGQKVATLVSERQDAGYHQVEWDASGFASGVYYYKINAGEFQDVKKMILLQ